MLTVGMILMILAVILAFIAGLHWGRYSVLMYCWVQDRDAKGRLLPWRAYFEARPSWPLFKRIDNSLRIEAR